MGTTSIVALVRGWRCHRPGDHPPCQRHPDRQ